MLFSRQNNKNSLTRSATFSRQNEIIIIEIINEIISDLS